MKTKGLLIGVILTGLLFFSCQDLLPDPPAAGFKYGREPG